MGGGLNIGQVARMAQEMQAQVAKAQAELRETVVEASSGGGAVRVSVTGAQELRAVHIDPDAVDPAGVDLLQDLVLAAVNEALARSRDLAERRMAAVSQGMGLPGSLPGLR